jgi:hypothetical protein
MHPSVTKRPARQRISAGGLLRALVRAGIGLVLAALISVGLVQAGLVRSPFAPALKGDLALARTDRAGLRVLFVGNSFTFYNSMPALVHQLAAADEGAPPIFAVEYAEGGWTLEEASRDDGLAAVLEDVRWDVVVLQEQSQLLSFPAEQRREETYPFARALQGQIASAGSRTILFMTWGYKEGDRRNYSGDTFTAMQRRLAEGYADLGAELSAPVALVGLAWQEALQRKPTLDLWDGDGKHPNLAGSYLAACVFYAMLSDRNPTRSEFTAGLELAEARFLQRVASDTTATHLPRQAQLQRAPRTAAALPQASAPIPYGRSFRRSRLPTTTAPEAVPPPMAA